MFSKILACTFLLAAVATAQLELDPLDDHQTQRLVAQLDADEFTTPNRRLGEQYGFMKQAASWANEQERGAKAAAERGAKHTERSTKAAAERAHKAERSAKAGAERAGKAAAERTGKAERGTKAAAERGGKAAKEKMDKAVAMARAAAEKAGGQGQMRVSAAAAAKATPSLLRSEEHTFSTGDINKVAAMDTDGSFVYTATYGQIIKENKMNVDDFGVLNLAESGFADVGALKVDSTHVYATASKVGGGQVLIKVDKALMKIVRTHTFTEAQNTAYAMVLDEAHIYTGMLTRPGRVLMLKKTNLEQLSDLALHDGEHDVKSLMWSATDAKHVYVNCDTRPGRVVKIMVKDTETCGRDCLMQKGTAVLNEGHDRVLAGVATDDDFLFVGTFTAPAKVVQLRKTDMSIVGTLTLQNGEDRIASMIFDSDFLYAGTATSPGKIVRIRRAGLSRVDALELGNGEDSVDAMTHGNGRIFAGLDTSPARIVSVSGYLEPVDCILSDWTPWSECSKTCKGGRQTRTRYVHTQMQNGGAACSQKRSEQLACADHIVCPEKCRGGQVWMAGSGTALKGGVRRTCATRDQQVVETGLSHCQCPPHKPFWHGKADDSDSFCATEAICNKGVTTLCQAADLTCKIEAGRLILERHSKRKIEDFHCRHHPGNRVDNNCRCLCKIGSETE